MLQKLVIVIEKDPMEEGELVHGEMLETLRDVQGVPIFEIVIALHESKHQGHPFIILIHIVLRLYWHRKYILEIFESFDRAGPSDERASILQHFCDKFCAGVCISTAPFEKLLNLRSSLGRYLMYLVDIHHLVVVYFLIHNILLPVLQCQCVLILLISAFLSVCAHLLGIQEVKVDSRFLAILNDHLKLIGKGEDLKGFDVERGGLQKSLYVPVISELLVDRVKVEPGKAAVGGLCHAVLNLSHDILIGLCLDT